MKYDCDVCNLATGFTLRMIVPSGGSEISGPQLETLDLPCGVYSVQVHEIQFEVIDKRRVK